jgi:hypothetical protein
MTFSKKFPLGDTWKAILLFTVIFLIATWNVIIHKVRIAYDGIDYFYPLLSYAIQSIRHGHLPLWDPYSNAGVPNHLEPQNFILNPLTYLLSLTNLHLLDAFNFFWLFFWWLGGIGIILLLKKYSSTLARVFAACAFTFSGFQIGHAQHTSYVYSASFLPWLFYFSELCLERKSHRYTFLAAAAGMLSVFGGYPVLLASNCLLLTAWMFYRAPRQDRGRVILHLSVIAITMAIAISPTLASIAIEGPYFFKREGAGRLALPNALMSKNAFTRPSFLTIFSPIISALCGPDILRTDWSMGNGYAGFLALPLSLLWIRSRLRERKRILPFIAAFAFFLILSTIHSDGIVKTFYYYAFFPVQFMLYSAGFRLYWIFLLALATGLGFTAFEKATCKKEANRIFTASFIVFAFITLVSLYYIKSIGYELFENHLPNSILARLVYEFGIFTIAILGLLVANGTLPFRRLAAFVPIILLGLLAFDARFQVLHSGRVSLARDFKSGELALEPTQRYSRYVRQSYAKNPGDLCALPGQDHLNGHLIQREFLLGAYTNMLNPPFAKIMESRFSDVLLNGENFYWLSPSTQNIINEQAAASELYAKTTRNPIPVYLDQSHPSTEFNAPVAFGTYGKVQLIDYQPNSVKLHVDVPPKSSEAFLASTERYSPSWQVAVDNGPFLPTVKNNLLFRGVFLTAGQHNVIFRYNPGYYLPLATLAWACLLLLLLFGLRHETR